MKHAYGYLKVYEGQLGQAPTGRDMNVTLYQNTLSADFPIVAGIANTPGGGMLQVGSVQVPNVVIALSTNMINFKFCAITDAFTTTKDILFGVKIGSNTAVVLGYKGSTEGVMNLNGVLTGISPGTYTIQLVAAKGAGTVSIYAPSSTAIALDQAPAPGVFSVEVFS